jgi:hypothetical protein
MSLRQVTGRLLESYVLLSGALAAVPSPPPKPFPIMGEGCRERGLGLLRQLRDTALD